jgi:allantoate deiminase
MNARHDAACAAAEWVLAVEAAARAEPGLVATVGRLEARPGAPNVVPGTAIASLDVRHAEDAVREAAVSSLRAEARRIGAARGVEVAWREVMSAPAVAADGALTAALSAAVAERGLPVVTLASGAGHDGVALAELTGVAMLFVRCADGISHHPDESVEEADVAVALDVLHAFVRGLAR